MNDTVIDVLVAGRVYSDLVFTGVSAPDPGAEVLADSFTISAGGAANRAVAAARLGARTMLLSEFGDDLIGHAVHQGLLSESNLDLSAARVRPGYHAPISVAITDGHDRAFVTYEEPPNLPPWPVERTIRVAHVGLGHRPVEPGALTLRNQGTILVGGVGWDPSGIWSPELLERLTDVDVVVMNEVEALGYTRKSDIDAALHVLAQHVGQVVVTLGSRGACAFDGARRIDIPSPRVRQVDPTGAGDAFVAAFMAATAWEWDFESRLRLAGAVAAWSVRSPGGARSAPYPAHLVELLESPTTEPGWSPILSWAREQSGLASTQKV
ncbi:MAG: PfkB family carbohydrate kinase [Gordonia sp. (in: high G+C Gram-positive bacteria)]